MSSRLCVVEAAPANPIKPALAAPDPTVAYTDDVSRAATRMFPAAVTVASPVTAALTVFRMVLFAVAPAPDAAIPIGILPNARPREKATEITIASMSFVAVAAITTPPVVVIAEWSTSARTRLATVLSAIATPTAMPMPTRVPTPTPRAPPSAVLKMVEASSAWTRTPEVPVCPAVLSVRRADTVLEMALEANAPATPALMVAWPPTATATAAPTLSAKMLDDSTARTLSGPPTDTVERSMKASTALPTSLLVAVPPIETAVPMPPPEPICTASARATAWTLIRESSVAVTDRLWA